MTRQRQGQIANPVYQDAKRVLNGAIYDSWRVLLEKAREGADREQFDDIYWISSPELHTVASVKKLAKFNVAAVLPLKQFLEEITPVAEVMADLKSKVVKRQVKSAEEQEAGKRYEPRHTPQKKSP